MVEGCPCLPRDLLLRAFGEERTGPPSPLAPPLSPGAQVTMGRTEPQPRGPITASCGPGMTLSPSEMASITGTLSPALGEAEPGSPPNVSPPCEDSSPVPRPPEPPGHTLKAVSGGHQGLGLLRLVWPLHA